MTAPDYFMGVDPGAHGALALYCPNPARVELQTGTRPAPVAMLDMPLDPKGKVDAIALARAVLDLTAAIQFAVFPALVENVASRPRQAGAFQFGLYTGIVHGVLATVGVPVVSVAPQVWKGAMGLLKNPGESYEDGKDKSRALAMQLFPDLKDTFKRKKDDGRAEALLMAVYLSGRK